MRSLPARNIADMRAEYDGLLHVLDKPVLSVFVIKIATKMVYRGERFFTEGMECF